MKAKRSKKYRKLMQQYELVFGFREPYQILVDAQIIQDAISSKQDLAQGLERTLHGSIKPMITQCSIRHLYILPSEIPVPHKSACIELAKQFERRRCNHHTLDEPLSTLACFKDVIDPKGSGTNKNRYAVATQDEDVKQWCQTVRGVPIVYIYRSVMLMKHMAASSKNVRLRIEKEKLKAGVKVKPQKRKHNDVDEVDMATSAGSRGKEEEERKKKKMKGLKQPNPLSVKKSKKDIAKTHSVNATLDIQVDSPSAPAVTDEAPDHIVKAKRKRKHKPKQTDVNEAEVQSAGD